MKVVCVLHSSMIPCANCSQLQYERKISTGQRSRAKCIMCKTIHIARVEYKNNQRHNNIASTIKKYEFDINRFDYDKDSLLKSINNAKPLRWIQTNNHIQPQPHDVNVSDNEEISPEQFQFDEETDKYFQDVFDDLFG